MVMMNMIKAIEINFIISSLIFLTVKILMSNFGKWKNYDVNSCVSSKVQKMV